MDESQKSRIIHAARSGQLTVEQYELYIKLLDDDPDIEDDVKWEEFLDQYLPASIDAELYAAAAKIPFPEKTRVVGRINYAVAASILLLIVSGWFAFDYFFGAGKPQFAATTPIEYFSGDTLPDGQLGYADGELAVGEKILKLWENERQKEKISYQFCNDTLNLYFREISDTTGFASDYRLTYFSETGSYFLIPKDELPVKLSICDEKPQPLTK